MVGSEDPGDTTLLLPGRINGYPVDHICKLNIISEGRGHGPTTASAAETTVPCHNTAYLVTALQDDSKNRKLESTRGYYM